jgi:hypothetical protein
MSLNHTFRYMYIENGLSINIGGCNRSAEDAYSSAAHYLTFSFVGGMCCPIFDFVFSFWIMIMFYTMLPLLFCTDTWSNEMVTENTSERLAVNFMLKYIVWDVYWGVILNMRRIKRNSCYRFPQKGVSFLSLC